jgi:sporadic carbohydrate cluster protein (TIGR04323 family)
MSNRSGFRGYVSSREFGGARMPVPTQVLVLRDYCRRKDLLYKLHLNENCFPHSYLVLESLVRNLDGFEGLLMCSMFMLPRRPERRAAIYEDFFRQGIELHLVMEEKIVRRPEDVGAVEEILSVYETLRHCPTEIPAA